MGIFDEIVKPVGEFLGRNLPNVIDIFRIREEQELAKQQAKLAQAVLAARSNIPAIPAQTVPRPAPASFPLGGVPVRPASLGFIDLQTEREVSLPMPTIPAALPGGAILRDVIGGAVGGAAIEGVQRFFGGGDSCPTLFTQPMERVSPVREVFAQNPKTGRLHVWRHMGRPILYSGDLAACKRVDRIARRARRRRPR